MQKITAPQAWATTTGANVRVGIVDTGVDVNHPDLAGRVAALVTCNDDSGDPSHCTNGGQDIEGHGTHVSGIIAADDNRPEEAAKLLGHADRLRSDVGVPVPGFQREAVVHARDTAASSMGREAFAADTLGEHAIEPGDLVSIWPWIIHRHRRLWEDPDAFMPERFAVGAKPVRHRYQYLPFGGGPRTCVGARLAMAEALTILAIWLRRWRFAPVPGREVRVSGMVTLRPKGGLPLILSSR